ncbi:glycosyltransferase family 2 protein [Brumicola nitratireducens]|uniref:glycosyltransferase family 2 protein n=1 Tax=Brumicola nitratireducens TaxID=300231 RepID=UPI001EE669CA|nr:glycosyltransferase family 2 protein [Glaciecola nitratireducens]
MSSLESLSYTNFNVIVVDNGSNDKDKQTLVTIDNIRLISLKNNLGYAGGNNIAMQEAFKNGADYVWALNNDAVTEHDTLCKLIDAIGNNKNIGLASPVIMSMNDNTVQHAVTYFNKDTNTIAESSSIDDIDHSTESQINMLWGTALIISKECYFKIGGFREEYFAYVEDSDLSMRAYNAGFSSKVIKNSRIYHNAHEGERPPHYYYYTTRNGIRFWFAYSSPRYKALKNTIWLIKNSSTQIQSLTSKSLPLQVDAIYLAYWHLFTQKDGEFNKKTSAPKVFILLIKFLLTKFG